MLQRCLCQASNQAFDMNALYIPQNVGAISEPRSSGLVAFGTNASATTFVPIRVNSWLNHKKARVGTGPPGAGLSGGESSPALLRCDSELHTALFENDHERVGVTRDRIGGSHAPLAMEFPHFGGGLFAEKTRDRTVRG